MKGEDSMLENAQVTISLKEFDILKNAYDELINLKRRISNSVEVDDSNVKLINADIQSRDVILKVNLNVIENIIRDYGVWNKEEYEWVDLKEVNVVEFVNKTIKG